MTSPAPSYPMAGSFAVSVNRYGPMGPRLSQLAAIVRGADTSRLDLGIAGDVCHFTEIVPPLPGTHEMVKQGMFFNENLLA